MRWLMKKRTRTVPLSLICTLLSYAAFAGDVKLVWDPNSETDLAGYKVYRGNSSRTYGTPVSLTLAQSNHPTPGYTATGLTPGATYFFAVSAYNTAGLESGFSNEVSTTIPTVLEGDLNGDLQVNVVDIQLMVNTILGVATTVGADMNKDGQVNVVDLQLLINKVLGK